MAQLYKLKIGDKVYTGYIVELYTKDVAVLCTSDSEYLICLLEDLVPVL